MSFWNLSDGKTAESTGSFDADTQTAPIPNNTQVKAAIDEIKWDEYDGDDYINARWVILDGEYKNRKIFHKLRVKDSDPKKADKAMKMLVAIDTNAGGELQKVATSPTDTDLQRCLSNKMMVLKLGVWKIDEDPNDIKQGNWVKAVSPMNTPLPPASMPTKSQPNPEGFDDFDDDIGF